MPLPGPGGTTPADNAASADNQGFTGHIRDTNTGLTYARSGYYDPAVGRFLSNDPVGFASGGPGFFNRYSYAFNDPVNLLDPDGRAAGPVEAIQEFKQGADDWARDVGYFAGARG